MSDPEVKRKAAVMLARYAQAMGFRGDNASFNGTDEELAEMFDKLELERLSEEVNARLDPLVTIAPDGSFHRPDCKDVRRGYHGPKRTAEEEGMYAALGRVRLSYVIRGVCGNRAAPCEVCKPLEVRPFVEVG